MTFNYQEYLQEKHSRFSTPDELLDQITVNATGANIIDKTRLILGEENEVYDVRTDSGINIILRISHERSYAPELWAMEQSRARGVLIPQILFSEEMTTGESPIYACVLSKEPGIPLSTSEASQNTELLRRFLNEAGHQLSLIHDTKTQGWGALNEKGQGKFRSFGEFAQDVIGKEEFFRKIAEKNGIDPETITALIKELSARLNVLQNEEAVLVHGDYSPKHILIDNGAITSILDFGGCKSGSPIYDFAWWSFWHRKPEQIEWLREGYDRKDRLTDFELKLHVLKGFLDLDLLYWTDESGHKGGIGISKENLIQDLEFLQSYEK